jgi:hypothetical protein
MRILVTYGWCRTAYIAAESLCRAGFEVYACGSTALSMVRVSRFVRGFDRVGDPFKEPEQYVTEISAIVKLRNIDVLLPVHENALAIQTYRKILPANLLIACPPRSELVRVLDKYEIIKIAASAKVAVPKTLGPANLIELESCAQELGFSSNYQDAGRP